MPSEKVAAMTDEFKQFTVDAMAQALTDVERPIVEAMVAAGKLPEAIREFQTSVGTHHTYAPFKEAGNTAGLLGDAFAAVSECHKKLDALRKAHKMPEPDAQTRDGGGGCKPVC